MVAFLINVSVISVSGAVCNSSHLSAEDQKSCENLDLNKASFLLEVCDPAKFINVPIAIFCPCIQKMLNFYVIDNLFCIFY
jgi:hypothetical protein